MTIQLIIYIAKCLDNCEYSNDYKIDYIHSQLTYTIDYIHKSNDYRTEYIQMTVQ